jgi:hypothetical protein
LIKYDRASWVNDPPKISGAPDERWDNDDLHQLGNIEGFSLEVIKFSN